ncbi:hypothetical protein C7212DRAFT_153062 [Tuber magnatum]|uniref:Uncharacterized protein n=1 Tax=Tuber magnatum TaxID=42249 RepID=A0A317SXU2_9PEZI|nr:hypothetical protein C7212DRAFT_153062 [Tuber magnatum]
MHQHLGIQEHASLLFEFGSQNNQGYWSTQDVVNHTLNSAIKIFEAVYPGYQGLFLYDNASSHSSYADDALRVQNMNLGSGGEQAVLRDGYFIKNGVQTIQKMVNNEGIPKGIEEYCEDCKPFLGSKCLTCETISSSCGESCCARRILSQQDDFQQQKGKLQEMIELTGHKIMFYPKFLCKLN